MTAYAKFAMEAGDQYLAAVSQAQEDFLRAIALFKPYVPEFPATPATLPGFPTPQEVVEVSFSFAEKLLKQQQDFTAKALATAETRTDTIKPRMESGMQSPILKGASTRTKNPPPPSN